MSVPLAGGVPADLADLGYGANMIAIDGTNVYWTGNGGIVAKAPLDGGLATNLVAFQDGITSCGAIAVADPTVYFAITQNGKGDVQSVPVDGGTPVVLAPVESSFLASSLALGANAIYWPANAELLSTPLDGGTTVPIASNVNANGVAVDARYVYWTQARGTVGGAVMRAPLDGGAPVAVATQLPSPQAIAVDGAGLYWTDYSGSASANGTIFMAPLDGGALRVLATGQSSPDGIATDGARVYWANCGVGADGGSVMAIAKP
jgi:hypothetical protein